MRPKLEGLAARQGGVITRAQALAAGYSAKEIRSLTRPGGLWTAVRRGVYAESELVVANDDPYDRGLRLQDRAAHVAMTLPHLMSHDSAARAWGVPMLRPAEDLVHITRFGVGGSRTTSGVKHHLTQLGLLDVDDVDGMRVTGLARTALDLAREHGLSTGLIAMDHVLRHGVTQEDLEAHLVPMWCWPGITRARAAVELADPGAETPGESLLRELIYELDIGRPETQFPVRLADGEAWCDLRVGCHAFEFDGFVKLQRKDLGGVATRPAAEVVWREKVRQDQLNSEGLGVSRVIWVDMLGARRRHTRARLLREFELTCRRLGTELPDHLADYARSRAEARRGRLRLPAPVPASTWLL